MNNSPIPVIVVLVPVRLDKTYFYLLPPDQATIKAGTIINVTFGNKNYNAIAIETQHIAQAELSKLKLRPVNRIYKDICLSEELMAFAQFFANYTLTPLGLVATMLLRGFAADIVMPQLDYISFVPMAKQVLKLTTKRQQLLAISAERESWQKSQLVKAAKVSMAMINGLVQLGFLRQEKKLALPTKLLPLHSVTKFSAEQEDAVEKLCAIVTQPNFAAILLSGITGSGKTEVYFEAVAQKLKDNSQILILLPEIALTQQFLARFKERFGATPAVWHSGLTKKQRQIIWHQVALGHIQVLIGARSALFLPFKNLQLIIVDEEHDSSYKQEENIFYNARDMAVARAKFGNFAIILSSATPSIETVVNVNSGKYKLIELKERYSKARLPQLSLVDMNRVALPRNRFLAPPLVSALMDNLKKEQQSILFLGRRGYAPITLCRSCGYRFSCPNCSAFLIEHKFHKALLCHHCGFSQNIPKACPQCHNAEQLVAFGGGVERIAEEVQELLPQARLMILSTDMIGGIGLMRQQLADISAGKVDIIIGTQLISKGHNFPKVSLVGVIDADIGLNNGDLRAAERSYQLLVQVTGRAGRQSAKSHGIIQTYSPQHPVIQSILKNDKESFYAQEIAMRLQAAMPPFAQLAALIISGVNNQATQDYARILRQKAPAMRDISVLGPAQAPLAMIRNQYRYRLLIKAAKNVNLQQFLRQWLAIVPKAPNSIKIQIDINPHSFF